MDDSIPLKRCSTCGNKYPATKEFFASNKFAPDHLQYECKPCNKKRRDRKRAQNPKLPKVPPVTKKCTSCYNDFPNTAEYFHTVNRKKTGKTSLMSICKKCNKEKCRQYDARNREQRKIYSQQYRLSNRENIRIRSQRYYQTNKERLNENGRLYYHTHVEEIKKYRQQRYQVHRQWYIERQRQYRKENPDIVTESHRKYDLVHFEQISEYQKRYRKTHMLQQRIYSHRKRALKKAAPGVLTHQMIQDKLKAQRYRCYYAACGHAKFEKRNGKYIFHLEHTIPLSRTEANPRHDINYVVLACPSCNLSKHNKLPGEWPEGGRLF